MKVSEVTMQRIIDVLNDEIGPTFDIGDLAQIINTAKTRCEADDLHEADIPDVVADELRKFKAANKIFGYGRYKYALLFENAGAGLGAVGA